ncbi:c-type cytochrome [Flavobacterium faecale]|uniref:c-type cytochrome n=1 Tax=Flavobacterium faecale TaxID=1355330 RepID=UPI003AAA406F
MQFILSIILASALFHLNPQTDLNKDYISVTNLNQKHPPLQESMTRGKEIYTDFCIQCHLANGKGDGKNFPPLDGSDWLTKKRNESIHAVKYGQSGPINVNQKKYNNAMPPMGLTNQEIADVMNYIMNSWSNRQTKIVTVTEVEKIKP